MTISDLNKTQEDYFCQPERLQAQFDMAVTAEPEVLVALLEMCKRRGIDYKPYFEKAVKSAADFIAKLSSRDTSIVSSRNMRIPLNIQ